MDHLGHDDNEGRNEVQDDGADAVEDLELDEAEGTEVTGGTPRSYLWIGT